jgi:hypothetical protein
LIIDIKYYHSSVIAKVKTAIIYPGVFSNPVKDKYVPTVMKKKPVISFGTTASNTFSRARRHAG